MKSLPLPTPCKPLVKDGSSGQQAGLILKSLPLPTPGTLLVKDGSHAAHERFFQSAACALSGAEQAAVPDFYKLKPAELPFWGAFASLPLAGAAGSLFLWDSRTIHAVRRYPPHACPHHPMLRHPHTVKHLVHAYCEGVCHTCQYLFPFKEREGNQLACGAFSLLLEPLAGTVMGACVLLLLLLRQCRMCCRSARMPGAMWCTRATSRATWPASATWPQKERPGRATASPPTGRPPT